MRHIDCKKYAQEILDKVKAIPHKKKLVILTVGDNPASASYVKGKIKDCKYCDIPYEHIQLSDDFSSKIKLTLEINKANDDDEVGGIIVQLPLPEGFDEEKYTNLVRADKDVDGFLPGSPFKPCTPEGIMHILHEELGDLEGRHVLVIGRGKLVGRPLAEMLLRENCTVTIAHSKTRNLDYLLSNPWDVIVSAAGKANLVNLHNCCADVVIDAGVNRNAEGKLVGDCYNFDANHPHDVYVTPVPGGIGLLTRAMLMQHVAKSK